MIKTKNTKGAMEMSVGTIVTIVLLMSVLVLGIFFVSKIFKTSNNVLDGIDQKVQGEIDNLFSTNSNAKFSTFPNDRDLYISKGEKGGFGFSVLNRETTEGTFTYTTQATEVASNCKVTKAQADNFVVLGKEDSARLGSGAKLEDAFFVKFEIPETAPLCQITYSIEIEKDGSIYTSFKKVLNIV
ncbi:hypothetical protein GW931_01635 [archaeon]|nr:hypothetical protein [archaeon]